MIKLILAASIGMLITFNICGSNLKNMMNTESDDSLYFVLADIQQEKLPQNQNKQTAFISSPKQQLDSIVNYRYNTASGQWDKKISKTSFYYDAALNDTLVITSVWDLANNHWRPVAKERFEYNAQMLKSYEQHIISKSGKRLEYSYNNSENVVGITESVWLFEESKWLAVTKNTNTYNALGILVADTLYYKYTDSDAWIPVMKTEYSYDSVGDLLADTSYNRQKDSDEWKFQRTTAYAFINGNLEQSTVYNWNSELDCFIPYIKKKNLYLNDEVYYGVTEFEWGNNNSEWIKIAEKILDLNDNRQVSGFTFNTWDEDTSKVVDVFAFDFNYSKESICIPKWFGLDDQLAFHHKISNKQTFKADAQTNELELFNEATYYYSANEDANEISSISQEIVTIYPNPAKDVLQVNLSRTINQALFELYDVSGQKKLSVVVNNNEKVSLMTVDKGFYIYSIRMGNQIITGKLIKE